jgi:ribonuclease HII
VLFHERCAQKNGYRVIVGIDEAGRGPLAGPVVVAAVFLKSFKFKNRIDDSKKLTAHQRQNAYHEIVTRAVYGVGIMNETAIDMINISRATQLACDMAIENIVKNLKRPKASLKNTILLCDGRLLPSLPYVSKEIIGGDGLSLSIAAASIVAKVTRDRIMQIYDKIYPAYNFGIHKGYGTRQHMSLIARFGLSPIHRRSFCRRVSA